jgi:hypothetical protein
MLTNEPQHLPSPMTLVERSLCSVSGGCLSAIVTLPMDVLVAQLQRARTSNSADGAGKGGLMSVIREMKWSHATRGLVARLAHVGLTTLVR